LQPVPERLPLDVRHGEPELAGGLARVVNGEDVGVLEAGGELDLPLEPVGPERRGELREEDLEGDRALVLEVLRQVDRGHPAAPERALKRVAVAQAGSQRGGQVGERGWGRDVGNLPRLT
jgi:hypothetical protein